MKKQTKNRIEWIFLICSTILFIVLLSSCRSKISLLKEQSNLKSEQQKNIYTSDSLQILLKKKSSKNRFAQESKNTHSLEDISFTQTITEYDTSKPIDPITGKTPIVKETINNLTRSKKKDIHVNNHKKEVSFTNRHQSILHKSKLHELSTQKLTSATKTNKKEIVYSNYFKIIILIGLLFGIYLITRKLWRRFMP